MNNLKEENIRRAVWHIKRHLEGLWNSRDEVEKINVNKMLLEFYWYKITNNNSYYSRIFII